MVVQDPDQKSSLPPGQQLNIAVSLPFLDKYEQQSFWIKEFPSLNETFLTNPFAEQTTAGGRKLYEDA